MPTVKLLKPRTVQIGGVIYHKGVVTPVDPDTARALDEDARFQVEGLDGRKKKSPAVHAKSAATKIREASDNLDPDVEGNFTADGRPSAEAISKALGEEISQHKVDLTLGLGGKGRVVIKEPLPPMPAPPTPVTRVKKVKLTPKKADASATGDDTADETKTGDEGEGQDEDDPTTDGAIS